ncbi:unnamed protein product [Effrenium voratum]|nr:unnamed protein product [Effrenium voratum]
MIRTNNQMPRWVLLSKTTDMLGSKAAFCKFKCLLMLTARPFHNLGRVGSNCSHVGSRRAAPQRCFIPEGLADQKTDRLMETCKGAFYILYGNQVARNPTTGCDETRLTLQVVHKGV